jgi:hypothetical protein
VLVAVAGMASVMLAIGADRFCAPYRCDLLQLSSPFIRSTMLQGWTWVTLNTDHATFAYSGNNVPYPLFGHRLTNRVYYVNIDRHGSWRFHDYARARSRPGASLPPTPLARASGELVPANEQDPAAASRPRYERMVGYRDAWRENLKALGVDHLFVSALSAYEIDYVWHNAGGFPIEDEWARMDPEAFTLVYENSQVRIYAVSRL